jgi:hypothetical protein
LRKKRERIGMLSITEAKERIGRRDVRQAPNTAGKKRTCQSGSPEKPEEIKWNDNTQAF